MPGIPFMMPGMAQAMMPAFHDHSVKMLSYMDQIAFDTIHRVLEMNRVFNDKMFDMFTNMDYPKSKVVIVDVVDTDESGDDAVYVDSEVIE